MGVAVGRAAVRGPAGMPDAEGRLRQGALGEHLLEICQLPGLLGRGQLTVRRTADPDRDARRVVAAGLPPAQALQDDGQGVLRADVTHDATHFTEGTGDDSVVLRTTPRPEALSLRRQPFPVPPRGPSGPRSAGLAAITAPPRGGLRPPLVGAGGRRPPRRRGERRRRRPAPGSAPRPSPAPVARCPRGAAAPGRCRRAPSPPYSPRQRPRRSRRRRAGPAPAR